MARRRAISDDRVFAAVQKLLAQGGERAVSFSAVAAATGLAGSTLVQRYGNRLGMIRAARLAAWDRLQAATEAAMVATADKGAAGLLKALGAVDVSALVADLRDPTLRDRALAWRAMLESALALRLGGAKAAEVAKILFAVWQGQLLWDPQGLRLKDVIKRLI